MTDTVAEGTPATDTAGWSELQYDHRSSKVAVAPFDLWARLRTQCPAIHSDHYDGFWFVSRYEDAKRVLTDYETFTAVDGVNIPRQNMVMLPLEVDPPLHRQYRALLNPPLAPQIVKDYEPWIRALAKEWVGRVIDKERFELCGEFAEPFAKRLAIRVIGFEDADLDQLDRWTELLSIGTRNDEEGIRVSMEFFGFLGATLMRRAQEAPRDDLISSIVFGTRDGAPVPFEEQTSLLLLLTFGGLHTTGAVIAGALVWLAAHPEDRARLRAHPELWETASDEFVRYVSPVTHMNRAAAVDTEMGGCPIHAGEKVMFGIGSANHDETVFERPEDVMLDRFPNHHLGFGAGPHRCVGSHLGKLGIRIAIEEFLSAFHSFEVEDYQAIRWAGGEGRHMSNVQMRVIAR